MSLDPARVRAVLEADERETRRRRQELTRDLDGVVAAASDVATDDEHDPEGATIAYERARVAALRAQADAHLDDIRRARQRLDRGDYFICEVCSREIAAERLSARPVARTCIVCASSRG